LQYTRHPIREIARIWHVSVPTVSNWMNDYNISRADYPHYGKGRRGPAQFKSNRLPVPERPHLLRYAAIESVAELAVRYGVSKSLVYRWLAQDEIDHKALRASSNRGMYYEKKKPRKRRKKTKKARG
jgi:transposase